MTGKRLKASDLVDDPLHQFSKWYNEAMHQHVVDPESPSAMALATASNNGKVSVRFVLFKGLDHRGFIFYTDYTSPKGGDLARNPRAEIAFYWPELRRQVRISGKVKKLPAAHSDSYFIRRPLLSRIATIMNRQSRPIPLESDLAKLYKQSARTLKDISLHRPTTWGGYRIVPNSIEFWQAGRNRLHDRFIYKRSGKVWSLFRLTP